MKELKIKIWNVKNVVLMEVLDQDESLRGKEYVYEASNSFGIQSEGCPCLFDDCICIKGDLKKLDNTVCCKEFSTVQKAEEYVEKAKKAVAEYNASIKEILDEKEKEYLRNVIKPLEELVRKLEQYKEEIKTLKKELEECKKDYDSIQMEYFSTGTVVKNKKTGKYGVILRVWNSGAVQVLEKIRPTVICTHDTMDTLEIDSK